MSGLMRPDLNRVHIEVDSFLGQAVALGQRFEQLPEHMEDALMAFLRAQGLSYAQRYRSGLALGRGSVEKGVRQALVCLDIGLEELAAGDLNQAVEILAGGDFEALRKGGWELAFKRLESMRQLAGDWAVLDPGLFLDGSLDEVELWCRIVPETWTSSTDESDEVAVDPAADYRRCRELQYQLAFMGSLPSKARDRLLRVMRYYGTFADLLRNLILGLALDLERLLVKPQEVELFARQCLDEKGLVPSVRQKIAELLTGHLDQNLDEEARLWVQAQVWAEIERLENTPVEALPGLFVVRGKPAASD